ncbi:SDR family oxidoreductase [Salinifilum ghardaiensis]
MSGDSGAVVITGASAGVGRALARLYGERGARVALLARGERGLAGAAEDVRGRGGTPLSIPVDVADADQVEAAAERAENELGPIDVWVNAAFTTVFGRARDISAEEFRRVTETTYLGFVHGTSAALRRMRPRDRGTIVQVGSALAYRGVPLQSAYCAAKHAIQGFHESLRCELLHEGSAVRTTMVQLPAVNTPQFSWVLNRLPHHPQPVPPIYQPEVAAQGILHAADHPDRRERWVGGSTAATLLANALAPGLLDRHLGRTGHAAQQNTEVEDPWQAANLWKPADGPDGRDYGAHGVFDASARGTSRQLWLVRNRGAVAAAGALAGAVIAAVRGLRR